jgi:hypothetical protein
MIVMNPPAWLPAMFPMSPWSEQVMEALYTIFHRDFVSQPARYAGYEVWFFPEKDRGKELIFWHLVEREDPPRSGNRLPDFRRSERLPWARPMLENCGQPEIKAWDYEEGDGDVHTYVWLEHFDYVIVMKRYRDGRRRLITAYWVDYESKRRALLKKYSKQLP